MSCIIFEFLFGQFDDFFRQFDSFFRFRKWWYPLRFVQTGITQGSLFLCSFAGEKAKMFSARTGCFDSFLSIHSDSPLFRCVEFLCVCLMLGHVSPNLALFVLTILTSPARIVIPSTRRPVDPSIRYSVTPSIRYSVTPLLRYPADPPTRRPVAPRFTKRRIVHRGM